jgi:hypothetical protein
MENMLLRTFRVQAAYLGGVYVILILKAWQVSKVSIKLDHTQCIYKQQIYKWTS